jgi:hypothetical protein
MLQLPEQNRTETEQQAGSRAGSHELKPEMLLLLQHIIKRIT